MNSQYLDALAATDERFGRLFAVLPRLEHRLRPAGFEGLFRLIIEQQLSVAAADTIKRRVDEGLKGSTPEAVFNADIDQLRAYGLSRPKITYAKALAEAVMSGTLDFEAVARADSIEATAMLCALKGIGRWSAEVYLMFCEGRLDLFPTGDIALREALGWLEGCETRPDEAFCEGMAKRWSPYRSVASHTLWAWYGAVKRGELSKLLG